MLPIPVAVQRFPCVFGQRRNGRQHGRVAVGELTGPDRLLLDAIIAALKKGGQFVFLIDGDETAAIENVQALARY